MTSPPDCRPDSGGAPTLTARPVTGVQTGDTVWVTWTRQGQYADGAPRVVDAVVEDGDLYRVFLTSGEELSLAHFELLDVAA